MGSHITILGAVVNLLLASFKGAAGFYGRSSAMMCDAVHSFSDLISDFMTLIAIRLGSLPPDSDHPYGHGRFESIGCLAIGSLLIATAYSFGKSALATLTAGTPARPGMVAAFAALLSIVSKEMLFRVTRRIGKQLNSQVITANAWHHRSDALSSLVAIVGIVGAIVGWTWLDPLAGIAVAGLVGWMGGQISLEALGQLTDAADLEAAADVRMAAAEVTGVMGVGDVRCRWMSSSTLMTDLTVVIDGQITLFETKDILQEVRAHIKRRRPEVREIIVQGIPMCPLLDATLDEAYAV